VVFLEDERWLSYDGCAPFFWKGAFSLLAAEQRNLAKVSDGSLGNTGWIGSVSFFRGKGSEPNLRKV
jgi:hypothetical protein